MHKKIPTSFDYSNCSKLLILGLETFLYFTDNYQFELYGILVQFKRIS